MWETVLRRSARWKGGHGKVNLGIASRRVVSVALNSFRSFSCFGGGLAGLLLRSGGP